jgi:peptidoglycan/LPS O-acetylase OafA/YrhL
MRPKPAYRPDIDGLRAVAVSGVVLYHYGATWLPGGFTGVDIFFVISGYLITVILRREIQNGEFSILRFYERRVRRIVPALFVVLAANILAGWLVLKPGDYADLGKSAAYAATGLGNLYFYGNTGYFDQASEMQPLLHTWSLGVEEQFYVVWPFALMAGLALIKSQRLFVFVFSAGVTLAFAYALRAVAQDPKAAFYLTHPRAWELAIGALSAFLPAIKNHRISRLTAAAGAFLIAFSFLLISETMPFPGFNALYACGGAALLIWPKARTLVDRSLGFGPLVGVGLISYSLYLWHWPLVVFFRYYANGAKPSFLEAIVLGTIACVCAYLSWRFIEKPFRKPAAGRLGTVAIGLLALLLTASAGWMINISHGFSSRAPAEALAMSSLEAMWQWDCPHTVRLDGVEYCGFGANWDDATEKGALWGDSHAQHLAPLLDAVSGDTAYILLGWCLPIAGGGIVDIDIGDPSYIPACRASYKENLDLLRSHPEVSTVVLSGAWADRTTEIQSAQGGSTSAIPLLKEATEELLAGLQAPDRQIYLIGNTPKINEGPDPGCPITASYLMRMPCTPIAVLRDVAEHVAGDSDHALAAASADHPDVTFVRPIEGMCSSGTCVTDIRGVALYRDAGHFRRNLPHEVAEDLAGYFGPLGRKNVPQR